MRLVVALAALASCTAFGALDSVAISQIAGGVPKLRAYVDLRADNDSDIAKITPAQLQAQVSGSRVPVQSIRPYTQADEGTALVFAVDVSRSIQPALFADLRSALTKWTDSLGAKDRAAIVEFGDNVRVTQQFTGNKAALKSAIANLRTGAGNTHLLGGLAEAIRLSRRTDKDLPLRRAIVVMSDGKDEGSGLTPEDVLETLRVDRVPIYASGASSLPRAERARYFAILQRLAVRSGGLFQELSGTAAEAPYERIRQRLQRAWVVTLDCAQCPADGRSHPVTLRFSDQGREAMDKAETTLVQVSDPSPSSQSSTSKKADPVQPWYHPKRLAPLAAVLIGVVAFGVFLVYRKRADDTDLTTGMTEMQSYAAQANGEDKRIRFDGPTKRVEARPGDTHGIAFELIRKAPTGKRYSGRLSDSVIVGRSEGSGLRVPEEEVSGQHCRLELVGGRVVIADLNSTNGTAVNGVPVHGRQPLESGDVISLGRAEFRFELRVSR